MPDYFWLDGVRCDDVGIRLQGPLTFEAPKPKMTPVAVPGRNGDLHYYEGAYNNVSGKANCFSLQKQYVAAALNAVSKWSLLNPGYHRLETTEEPDIYRMAAVTAGHKTEIRMKILAPYTLEFDCKPQKFLKSGQREIKIKESGSILYNEWFPSLPLITVYGSGEGELSINGTIMQFLDGFSGPLIYDADTQNAYYNRDNKNGEIKAFYPLVLPNGECNIAWSGGVEYVSIIPRWWTL